jgi:stress-induced morphogen
MRLTARSGTWECRGWGEDKTHVITHTDIEMLIRAAMPDAVVQTRDRTGTLDHYNIRVASSSFAGKSLLDQHRMVYEALQAALGDGRLHAVELRTEVLK